MKKNLKLVVAALAVIVAFGATKVSAADLKANVFVTIADGEGKLAMAAEQVEVTDIDEDGALTVNDALYCAHEAAYEGGAAAGYASYVGDYGLALSKLWGVDNGGGYGYFVNNASAWSAADPVAEGDYVNAFVYTDNVAWSDTYSFFDVNTAEAEADEEITLTLSAAGYDESFNPVTLPVAGAVITVDGEETEFVTAEDGTVAVSLPEAGEYVISAVSSTQKLVPPVVRFSVTGAKEVEAADDAEAEDEEEAADDAEAETAEEDLAQTGASAAVFYVMAALLGCGALLIKRKNSFV